MISNNVAFFKCRPKLVLSLCTPNDVLSIALQSLNSPVTSKGSDQTARMRRLIRGFAGRTYHFVGNLMSRLISYLPVKSKIS